MNLKLVVNIILVVFATITYGYDWNNLEKTNDDGVKEPPPDQLSK